MFFMLFCAMCMPSRIGSLQPFYIFLGVKDAIITCLDHKHDFF